MMHRLALLRPHPVLMAILTGLVFGALLLLLSGQNPLRAYAEMVRGALAPRNWNNTLVWAVPMIGMTLVAALPLRGGMVNLGGDGQLVIGGFVAAMAAIYLPLPGPLLAAVAILSAMLAAGLYAALAALGQTVLGIPMLISSLLLSYPAIGLTSWAAGFPLRDTATGLAQTLPVPEAARLPMLFGPVSTGVVLMALVAAVVVWADRRSVPGYELRMRGLNARFARYGGVPTARQTVTVMFLSGALAGLTGAIIVLGTHYRFINGALVSPGYTWSGLMAALLAGGEPLMAIAAGFFFAALQTGGFAMQREIQVPRVLSMVLQAIIILFVSLRNGRGAARKEDRS
ncbi:ABC transporter permease [Pseudooceanicola sp. CBS1P-1]|uniref:ABC transporter permease n=1 Tax=Pseudooceanicola albus TaxID=2692189 RepID=A0A6L7G8H5_9RHOB|nr:MULTISPECIES: ABC transporter permease [Pseudooceanicola]MBT9385939.1 ABC transporter permease [Pseudooceanicola endophyticus]MXN19640.1 ABC transporter permease [Pseudooceanicola albus]